jgi:hypothetical protein
MDTPLNPHAAPSTAARPDLDWSQIRETIQMINLTIAQIEMALKDSSGSVEVLTNSFTGMYGNLMALVEAARQLPDSAFKSTIEEAGSGVSAQMQHAIVAFQFYDRLTQRLSHACRSLEDLSGVVNDPQRLYNPFAWNALQQKIRAKYTMEDEKLMFDTLIATGSVEQALKLYVDRKHQESPDSDDIELF